MTTTRPAGPRVLYMPALLGEVRDILRSQMGLLDTSTGFGSQEQIDRAIARAAAKLGDSQLGIVVHWDTEGELSGSLVKRFGDHLTLEGGLLLDTSDGWHFDREHLAGKAELVWTS